MFFRIFVSNKKVVTKTASVKEISSLYNICWFLEPTIKFIWCRAATTIDDPYPYSLYKANIVF